MKKTGIEWAEILNIKLLKFEGWFSEKEFKSEKITRAEFLNRAANSTLEKQINVSRRDAAKLLSKIKS